MLLEKLLSIEDIKRLWKQPRAFSPIRWTRDLFSKGLYSEFISIPYVQLLRNKKTIHKFCRHKKDRFLQTLEADRDSLKASWDSLESESRKRYLRSIKIDQFTAVQNKPELKTECWKNGDFG